MQIGYAVVSDRKIIQPAVCTVMRTNLLVIVSLTLFFGCTAKPADEESSPPLSATLELRSSAAMGNKDEPQPPSRATEADQPPTQATLPTNDAAAVLGWEPNSPLPTSVHELFSEAEATAGGLVSRYPDLLDASEIAARIFWIGGKPLQAENVWNRVLESQPNYPYALHGLGQVATKKGDFQSAADYHWRAYQALPTYVDAALGASNARIKTGALQRAIELLTSITNQYANTALAWIRLGQAHTAYREYASAELAFSKALAINANDAEALCGFALAAARNGNTAEALAAKKELAELRTVERQATLEKRKQTDDLANQMREIAAKYTSIGQIYFAKEQYDTAESIWNRAAQLDKLNRDARGKLAGLHMGFQDAIAALAVCQELSALDPDNVQYKMNLAMMFDRAKMPIQAIDTFQSLAKSNPSGRVFAMLADAHARHGNPQAARQAIEKAIELEPTNAQWHTIRNGLPQQ